MGEGTIKKRPLFLVILGFLILIFASPAYSWQGRMAGMGDPYGLLDDESDFLIHPGLLKGEESKFYSNYRFNYRDMMYWNYTLDRISLVHPVRFRFAFKTSGDEKDHDALLGTTLPLGQGNMGLFFQYTGNRGHYNGHENEWAGQPLLHQYSLKSDLNTFSSRLLYSLPLGDLSLGSEIQLSYRNDENRIFFVMDNGIGGYLFYINPPIGRLFHDRLNLLPFMFPWDSKYWEALLKGSIAGQFGPTKITLTLQGSFIFQGKNKYDHMRLLIPGLSEWLTLNGNVKGWDVGGNLWLTYSLTKDLSFPFLLKIAYEKKTRDGDGSGTADLAAFYFDYKNREEVSQIEVGGGVDKEFTKGTRGAVGIYYGYIQEKGNFFFVNPLPLALPTFDFKNYPNHKEHQILARLSGEKIFYPSITIRMGFTIFYSWVREDFEFNYSDIINSVNYIDRVSLDGPRRGISASVGGTVKFQRFSLEPFVTGGYQRFDLAGDGINIIFNERIEMDRSRKEWFIGGGLSILF